jgi:membrane-bound serine protease (ClpP class)
MTFRIYILSILSDPNTAYLVFVCGGILIVTECLRPGHVFPGVTGAVGLTVSLYALALWTWTPAGSALLAASIVAAFASPVICAVLFTAGSLLLFAGDAAIHPALAGAGGIFALLCSWLLRIASRARAAKRDANLSPLNFT